MKRILIVEDDHFLAKAYQAAFDEKLFQTELVFEGDTVLDHVANFKPDIIILDILLPGKNGFTILGELKQHPKWKQIPVIVASNLGQPAEIQHGKSLGAAAYIVKSETSIIDLKKMVISLTSE